jgi:methylmalonyl-CoA mutase N-terminal domain/subunit
VVGVNRFTREEEPAIPIQHIDEALERRQVERVKALRARRDPEKWRAALDSVREHARGGQNLMPVILEAVESYATVGEIAAALREVFGEYRESIVV